MFLLLISDKGGYRVHSIHTTRVEAESWEKCKQRDGDDTAIAVLNPDEWEEIAIAHEKAKEPGPLGIRDALPPKKPK